MLDKQILKEFIIFRIELQEMSKVFQAVLTDRNLDWQKGNFLEMVKMEVNIKEFLCLITFFLMSNQIYNVVLVPGIRQSESLTV